MNAVGQSGIKWGVQSFSEPRVLVSGGLGGRKNSSLPPLLARIGVPGLYVIMIADPSCSPRPFRALYFGQSEDMYGRANSNHENFLKWCGAANGCVLYVSFCAMIGSTKEQRETAETALIDKYNPACNEKRSVSLDWLWRS